ncbi:MAG: PEP-CTERM sorting domain-containing protein [Gammaproteobacteria bacterium]|nr:MAG: PEP-CTERM sorting domain-containing protein [Gammaproteobacteria bacterium]
MTARIPLLALTLFLLAAAARVPAATISWQPIDFGQTFSDSVRQDSSPDPGFWDYWSFSGNAGDIVTITVRREAGSMDPAFALWDGLESDTTAYTSLDSDSASHTWLGKGDDELTPAVPGPWGDARLTVTLAASGDYGVAVAEVGTGPASLPELGYNINLERVVVPLPPSLILLLSALSLLFVASRAGRR